MTAKERRAVTRIKRFVDDHLDLTGFLGFVVLVLLMRVSLDSTKNLTIALLAGAGLVVVISLVARRKAGA
jgi:hypothetical protein